MNGLKLKINIKTSKKELYIKEKELEWKLKSLQDIQTQTIITSFIEYRLNSLNIDSKEITREILREDSEEIQIMNKRLDKELKLKIKEIKKKDYTEFLGKA